MAKFIPNWNCHYWVSQQTELTQSKTPPTAITDSIMLSKGTWSIKDIMPQIRRENHSCTNCTSFKSFIHYVLNSYTTGGYFTPFYRTEKRLYQRKLFYKAFSYFPLSKIKQEDSWRWWQSHIDYSCFSTS